MSEPASISPEPAWYRISTSFILFTLTGLLALSAGYDWEGHLQLRIALALCFITLVAARNFQGVLKSFLRPLPMFFFFLFVIFELLRFFWGSYHLLMNTGFLKTEIIRGYTGHFTIWILYFLLFVTSYNFVRRLSRARLLFFALIAVTFFLAMNSIPPLALKARFGYLSQSGATRLLHPLFYSSPELYRYIFPLWSNMNWVGDYLGFGVFAGFGLGFYELYRLTHSQQYVGEKLHGWGFMILNMTLSLVSAAGIFLLLSRGTIVFFVLSLIFYFAIIFTKVRFRFRGILIVLILVIVPVFLNWAGNGSRALKEVKSIQGELDNSARKSFAVNKEGADRALRMFQKYPILGIGRGNYGKASDEFSALGEQNPRSLMASEQCMSHYLSVLAEEGSGAFLYFLFLLSWVFAVVTGLLKTQSRLQLCLSLSLAAPVLLVLGHAAINDLMDRFSMPALVYISMGAALGILSSEFQRD